MTLTSSLPAGVDLDVRLLSGNIGAEIRGVDLTTNLDPDTVLALRTLLLRHKVVFFPGQHLEPGAAPSPRRTSAPSTPAHPVVPGLPDHPEVFEIDYSKAARPTRRMAMSPASRVWHGTPTSRSSSGRRSAPSSTRWSFLPSGGDTLWSNQVAAYEGLSTALQRFLDGLTALHDGKAQFQAVLDRVGEGEWDGLAYTALQPVEHPVVVTHPETGERALFVEPRVHQPDRATRPGGERPPPGVPVRPQRAPRVHRSVPLDTG